MINIDLVYKMWEDAVLKEHFAIVPNIKNENHIFELGKILNALDIDPFLIDTVIENIKNREKIVRINEERERKVPPGHILVKNKKSGYLYVILKSTYNDNPERYSLPTSLEKSEWETGKEMPDEVPEDDLIKTPRVAKAKIKADPSDSDIKLQGDVEAEEPQDAILQSTEPMSISDYGVDLKHFQDKERLVNDEEFKSKRKNSKLELPETLEPYRIPDEVKQSALVPEIYIEIIERIINTYNVEEASDLNFYVKDLDIDGTLKEQLGKLIAITNLTLADEIAEYFTNDLKEYVKYIKQYDSSNETSFADDSALDTDWINKAESSRKKMLNFLSKKFSDGFMVVAATSSDAKDLKSLNFKQNKNKNVGDANVKVSANDKEFWLRIKLEIPKQDAEDSTDEDAEN